MRRGAVRTSARSNAHRAADIPGFSLSSSGPGVVVPGEGFVVGLAGFEAAVEDADPAVGELAEGGLVADLPGPEGLVVGLGAGGAPHRAERPLLQRVAEAFVAGVAGHHHFLGA